MLYWWKSITPVFFLALLLPVLSLIHHGTEASSSSSRLAKSLPFAPKETKMEEHRQVKEEEEEEAPGFAVEYCNHNPSPLPLPALPVVNEEEDGIKGLELVQVSLLYRHGDRTSYAYNAGTQCWPHGEGNPIPSWDCGTYERVVRERIRNVESLRGTEEMGADEASEVDIRSRCTSGQLTRKGRGQLNKIGFQLRKRYVKEIGGFMPELLLTEADEEVQVAHMSPKKKKNSSDVEREEEEEERGKMVDLYARADATCIRCFDSTSALVAGLYPPGTRTSTTSLLSIETVQEPDVFSGENWKQLCAKEDYYYHEWMKSEAYREHVRRVSDPVLEEVRETLATGDSAKKEKGDNDKDKSDDINTRNMVDCMLTHTCHGFPQSANMTNELYERMFRDVEWMNEKENEFPSVRENARSGSGFLFGEMYQRMLFAQEDKLKKLKSDKNRSLYYRDAITPQARMNLYGGHDSTLTSVLIALGIYDNHWPKYASMLGFEFYEVRGKSVSLFGGERVVRFFYNGKIKIPPFCKMNDELKKAGLCKWEDFDSFLRDVSNDRSAPKNCNVTN
eukprot:Nk52_evm44s2118 gene=Nk52_evmTU44s2118